MRNELPGHLTDFRSAIQYWTSLNCYAPDKVKILTELYQGSNPLLPDDTQFSDELDVSAGVCDGVALTWINKNLLGQGKQFQEYAESDWEVFAEKQVSIRLAKQVFKAMRQRLAQEKKAVNVEQAKMGFLRTLTDRTGITSYQKKIDDRAQANKDADEQIEEDFHAKYQQMILPTSNPNAGFIRVGKCALLSLATELQGDQGNRPAYYVVHLGMAGGAGHAVAFHLSDQKPRFVDANTCEFEFASFAKLEEFLEDYLDGLYRRLGFLDATGYRFGRASNARLMSYYSEGTGSSFSASSSSSSPKS